MAGTAHLPKFHRQVGFPVGDFCPDRVLPTHVLPESRVLSLRQAADKFLPRQLVLLTDTPMQAVHDNLVRRVFVLGYMGGDARVLTHTVEYMIGVSHEQQVIWAAEDFRHLLSLAGIEVRVGKHA